MGRPPRPPTSLLGLGTPPQKAEVQLLPLSFLLLESHRSPKERRPRDRQFALTSRPSFHQRWLFRSRQSRRPTTQSATRPSWVDEAFPARATAMAEQLISR